MANEKPVFNVTLNGEPYLAKSTATPVGGCAHANVSLTINGNTIPVSLEFYRGAVIEDTRQRAEVVLRSFERNNGQYAFLPSYFFSMWDNTRLSSPAPAEHYQTAEPELTLDNINNGIWTVSAYAHNDLPLFVIEDNNQNSRFITSDPTLMRDIAQRFNNVAKPHKKITAETDGEIFRSILTPAE